MKIKVGTLLDDTLYRQVQEIARQERRRLNEVLEEALRMYIEAREKRPPQPDLVKESCGRYRVAPEALTGILREDLYYDT